MQKHLLFVPSIGELALWWSALIWRVKNTPHICNFILSPHLQVKVYKIISYAHEYMYIWMYMPRRVPKSSRVLQMERESECVCVCVFVCVYIPFNIFFIYLNHIRLHKALSYHSYSLYFFTLLTLNFIYLCTLLCVYILLLLSCFGCYQYILLLSIISLSFYHNHTI